MRLLFLFFLTLITLFGRDNPFFPADPNEKQNQTTNKVEVLKPFSKQEITLPNSARAVKKIIIRYQNLDGSISDEELPLNNSIDWHEPFVITQKTIAEKKVSQNKEKRKVINTKFISFEPFKKSIKLHTQDKILRNFMLTSPHRVVMDFARDTSFKPKTFKLNMPPFKQIRMGNHDKYYRVVIELDGQYRYKLQMSGKDYTIVCY